MSGLYLDEVLVLLFTQNILMELELIEPTLYLDTDAQAADRLADALEKAVLMET